MSPLFPLGSTSVAEIASETILVCWCSFAQAAGRRKRLYLPQAKRAKTGSCLRVGTPFDLHGLGLARLCCARLGLSLHPRDVASAAVAGH
jgi:hypothetical protein